MKSLLIEVIKAGLPTAVVTFSPQARLIKEVLTAAIGDKLTRNIVIIDSKKAGDKQRDGKIPHLKAAKEKLAGAASATMRQTVLIDDDKTNIAKCIKCGAHAVHVDEHASERDLEAAITHAMMSISNGITAPAPVRQQRATSQPIAEISTGLAVAEQLAGTPTTAIASFEEWKEMKEKDHLTPTPSAVAAKSPPPAAPRSRAHPKDKYNEMDQIEQMLNAFQQNSMSPVSSPMQLVSSPPRQPNTVHVTRRTSTQAAEWQQQRRSLSTSPLRVKIGRELLGSPPAQDSGIALRRVQSSDTVISRKPAQTQPDVRGALRKIEHNERPKQLDILSPKKSEISTHAGAFQNHPMASLRSPNNFREKHAAAVSMSQPKMMSPRAMITSPTGRHAPAGMQLTGPPMGRNQAIASPRATRGRPGPPPGGKGKGGGKGMRV